MSERAAILAFTADQTCRLTGLSKRQLAYWDNTGFFSPGLEKQDRRAYARLYTFRDIVGLRVIAMLRQKLPLQELRRVGQWLHRSHATPWSSLTLFLVGRKVHFLAPDIGGVLPAQPDGQLVIPVALEPIMKDVEARTQKMRERTSDQIGAISRHRYVAHNAPVISGTRIPTKAVWNLHAAGYDVEQILQEYPRLAAEDVRVAVDFEMQRRARTG